MGYQIGVTPLQMVTAASVVANGGTLFEPRIVSAVTREGVRSVVKPKAVRTRDQARDGGDADDDHGAGGGARHRDARARWPATRSPARPGRPTSWSTAATRTRSRTCRSSASCRRATRALTVIVMVDSPRDGARHRRRGRGADLPAHRRRRAALPGRAAERQPGAAGDRPAAQRAGRAAATAARAAGAAGGHRATDGGRAARPARLRRARGDPRAGAPRPDRRGCAAPASSSSSHPSPARRSSPAPRARSC